VFEISRYMDPTGSARSFGAEWDKNLSLRGERDRLMAKLQAYGLQDEGLDTVEANHALGFKADCRDFALPVAIVRDLGVSRVRLLSNNPEKFRALINAGTTLVEDVPCEAPPTTHSFTYLR
jgi:3,4-dihydroxy 2-butanone 4-phosphate synthase/GTP cyclohydrolase II